MKIIATLLLLSINIFSFSQKTQKDTTVSFISNWMKGEEKIIEIVRTKEAIRSGKPSPPFKFSYEAHVSIVDSTSEGYTIKWVFHLPEEYKKANPGIEEVMPVYEGLKMIFTTTKPGEFKELLNWKEVKDAYIAMMELSVSKNIDDSARAAINKTYEIFNSKQMVEGALIKEIQLYHAPYGGDFSSEGTKQATSMENPFGGEPLSATTTQMLSERYPDSYTAFFGQELDSTGINIMMNSMLNKIGAPLSSFTEEERSRLSKIQMTDYNVYKFHKLSGWITALTHERKANMAGTNSVEKFVFTMK